MRKETRFSDEDCDPENIRNLVKFHMDYRLDESFGMHESVTTTTWNKGL